MKKIIICCLCLSWVFTNLMAQVNFSLSLLSDQETYLVSMIPTKSIANPMNTTSNIQVVLKVPLDKPFSASELQSQVSGIDWTDNAIQDHRGPGENYALCAFVMVQNSTKSLVFESGVEQPLFTFKNGETGCVGAISLPDNQDYIVKKAVARGHNFTQNITVLGARGNAYTGVVNQVANCNVALTTNLEEITIVEGLKAWPVPTSNDLTIEWTNPESYESLQLDLINATGQLLQSQQLDPSQGLKNTKLAIAGYSAGLYNFRLRNDRGGSQYFKFIVVNKQ